VTIKRATFHRIPILSLPSPFKQIQYLKSAAEKQTVAVCASCCFMTPETVILQCRKSAKKQEDFQILCYVTQTNSIPFIYHKTVLDTALLIKMFKII
jgi:hypothetical protein